MKIFGLILLVGVSFAATGPYTGHKLIEVPNNSFIQSFKESNAIDVWDENRKFAMLRLTPSQFNIFKLSYPLGGGQVKVLSDNVQELADKTSQQPIYRSDEDWFDNYHTYEDIKKWYINWSKSHPNQVKYVPSIGKTFENNDIFAVHLTNPSNPSYARQKNKIWFQSLIHAREWISGSTTQYIFNELVKNSQSDPTIKKLLDENEIIFIPVVNPDGYKFTQIQRFWRKNRNIQGVDINRNFPFHWGGPGASTNPLADDYRGPSAGSELETKAITNYFKSQGKIAGAIDFHSFSELVLRPWGDTKEDAPDEAKLKELGDGVRDVIKLSRGTEYTSEKSIDLYATSGTTADWFYGAGKSYGYTIELSPKDGGLLGFAPPPSDIKPVGKELYPAAVYFIQYVSNNPIN